MERVFWQSIVKAKFALPEGYSAQDLLPELLSYLGSTDPELRDQFGYFILGNWIEAGHYTPAQLRAILEQVLPNLGVRVGESGTDSVFLRAFSVLIVSEVISADNRQPFLSEREVRQVLDKAITYLLSEQDLRGYVPGKGWAHSAAHTADLLRALAKSRYCGYPELDRLMTAIADKVMAPTPHRYDCDEDERLVSAVMAILDRNALGEEQLAAWVERLFQPPGRPAWRHAHQDDGQLGARHNTKLFLHALHLRLRTAELPPEGAPALLELLVGPLRAMAWA